ncbi:MAG: GldG family protein [Cyclobacteriaceae bacterium]|nr:GldG family protein [Cyclobacteriaceae bacterium]
MKQKLLITTILVVGIVLVINFLSNELHLRLDFTDDKQYTLSKATIDILKGLEEPVTVKAYFSQDLPANIGKTKQDFQDLLVEYANRSGGMIAYEFINPNESESTEQQATQNGIQPVMINVREKDQMKQQKAFLGASISLGDKRDVIPFVQPGAAMEYALSTAIKKISVANKPLIGFLQGHGEPPIADMMQASEQLHVLYETQDVRLDSLDIPATVKTLAIIRPTDSIPAFHLQKIDAFLARGGRVLVAINRVDGNLQQSYGMPVSTGLENWLAQKGITVQDAFVVDAKCGSVTVQQQQGFFSFQSQMSFPYLPAVSRFANHPITKGLETVLFEFVSPVTFTGDTSKRFTPLAFSSEQSGSQKAPLQFDIQKQWTEADFPQSGLVVAGVVEGKLAGNNNSKMVVIGDGDLAVNGPGQQARRLQPDNVNLVVNSIDWLSDDTGLIDLRTKGVTTRPIRQLEDTTKTLLKYGNFLLPILLVIGYGLVRMQRNRMTRFKRMSENYEER